jgi:DNA-binding LacI/PurR family transcriptional regulator
VASNTAIQGYLAGFFEKVLAAAQATAWVCSDDKTAVGALAFLKARGKKVPAQISLIGFNNWPDERELQISAFDFNMNGMAQEALRLIVDKKSLAEAPAVREMEGYVVERRTTRR